MPNQRDSCTPYHERTRYFTAENLINLIGGPENASPLIFVVVGLASLLLVFAFMPPPLVDGRYRFEYETIVVVFATVLLAGLIQVLTAFVRWWGNQGQRAAFCAFFGDEPIDGVVPDLSSPRLEPKFIPPESNGARPTGTKVVPFGDLKAAISLAELFESFGVPFKIVQDPHVAEGDPLERSAVAIGLGFNSLTRQLAANSGLFDITFDAAASRDGTEKKDDFLLNGQPHPNPTDKRDFALIVRVPSACRDGKVRPAFVCAGRCAHGTAAAGYFIKHHWRSLYEWYIQEHRRLDEESLAVEIEYETWSLMKSKVVEHCFPAGTVNTTLELAHSQ